MQLHTVGEEFLLFFATALHPYLTDRDSVVSLPEAQLKFKAKVISYKGHGKASPDRMYVFFDVLGLI